MARDRKSATENAGAADKAIKRPAAE